MMQYDETMRLLQNCYVGTRSRGDTFQEIEKEIVTFLSQVNGIDFTEL